MSQQTEFKVGDTVALAPDVNHRCPEGREDNSTAQIKHFINHIPGGVVLTRELHGCRFWNVSDLVKVEDE